MRPYLMVAPAMVVFGVFIIYPIFYMIYLSFFDWNLIGEMKYIGLENYTDMLGDKDFWQVLGNSVYYMVMVVIFQMVFSLLLAAYLNRNTRTNRILQSIAFTPYITSMVSVAFIWMWLMDSDYGLLNYLLSLIGIDPIGWLSDPKVAMNSLVLVSTWKGLGYNTIIIISAMQSVPGYLYEAAALDKTPKWKAFWKITLPMISPMLFYLIITGFIGAFKAYSDAVALFGTDLNAAGMNTIVGYVYDMLYGDSGGFPSYASAAAVILFWIILTITCINLLVSRKRSF